MHKKIDKDKLALMAGLAVIFIIVIGIINLDKFFKSPEVSKDSYSIQDYANTAGTNLKDLDYGTNPDAKVTIVEYSDFECPYCAKASSIVKRIRSEYGSEVNIVFKHFPVHGQSAILAAAASECARDQGKFWEYHYALFDNQYRFSKDDLNKYAKNLNLNISMFTQCLDSGMKNPVIVTDMTEGKSNNVRGTPTFFVNGIPIVGAQDYSVFKDAIDKALSEG